MASRHGKRKIAKAKWGRTGRTSKMHEPEEEEIDLDDTTASSFLMGLSATRQKRSPHRFGLLIALFLVGCVVVIGLAGLLAWTLSKDTEAPANVPPAPHAPAEVHNTQKNDPAYGLSTKKVFDSHQAVTLTSKSLTSLANAVDVQDLKRQDLNPLLIQRVPDTPGSQIARDHIVSRLNNIGGWDINLHTFQENTPYGSKTFTNIIATANPDVKRRLVLACHYDSKYFIGEVFIGATDSALPCAQILYLVRSLADPIRQANATNPPVTLQLIFFDGEEAFVRWSDTDSLYGARRLSQDMLETPHPFPGSATNLLHGMDMFILLDLLGARKPSFKDFFPETSVWYNRMMNIEQRLRRNRLMATSANYFSGRQMYGGGIEDDHIPFLKKGVRILHLISYPFPTVWHTAGDDASALDDDTISNLSKIFHAFVVEYLGLPIR